MDGNFGENINPENRVEQKFKKPRWFKVVVGAFIALFLLVAGFAALKAMRTQNQVANIKQMVQDLQDKQNKLYQEALTDTYGGKTPQETLQMYISAVEKGDYELASKYFVINKREKESETLKNSLIENTKNIINLLKISLKSSGTFSTDKTEFVISRPLLVDFVLYPSGVWKISEI